VNAVAPGPTETRMYDQLPQFRRDDVMRSVYAGRVCKPHEVAAAIFWLGSDCPEYINGSTLDVNNGSSPLTLREAHAPRAPHFDRARRTTLRKTATPRWRFCRVLSRHVL
jgi:NAD(P)-dependent dehydrogenase (short-subunit alcohol dehydrogenase family)